MSQLRRSRELWLGSGSLVMFMALTCGGCGLLLWARAQVAEEYLVPADYRGWALIRWEVPDCPPLRSRGITRVVVLDSTGRACTSSKPELRAADFHFLLIATDGARQELPLDRRDLSGIQAARWNSQNDPQNGRYISRFFVGTYADAQNAGASPLR